MAEDAPTSAQPNNPSTRRVVFAMSPLSWRIIHSLFMPPEECAQTQFRNGFSSMSSYFPKKKIKHAGDFTYVQPLAQYR